MGSPRVCGIRVYGKVHWPIDTSEPIEIVIVYNMYRMRRFTPNAVCAGCYLWALPTMPYKDLQVRARPLTALIQPLQRVFGGFTPPGECARRGDGCVQLGTCEGALCGGAARGRAGFDAVYK
jgi:hypothetical protein